jgi:hypothetical protein
VTERKNLVLSKQFREALEDAMIRCMAGDSPCQGG